jgi:hypothetical protein
MGIAVTGAQAQGWQTELGLLGGFVRLKPAGTSRRDQTDILSAPGFDLGPALPVPSAIYLTIPVGDKMALEPSFSGTILSAGNTLAIFQAGLRVNYSLTKNVYGAAGALLGHINTIGYEAGVQVAGGYRFHLTGPVSARLEANVALWKGKSGAINPIDTYGLLFGISSRL